MNISKNKATTATKPKDMNFLQLHLFQLLRLCLTWNVGATRPLPSESLEAVLDEARECRRRCKGVADLQAAWLPPGAVARSLCDWLPRDVPDPNVVVVVDEMDVVVAAAIAETSGVSMRAS